MKMKKASREQTNMLITACESGVITWETIARECLNYMSETDVRDMLDEQDEQDEQEEEENDAWVSSNDA